MQFIKDIFNFHDIGGKIKNLAKWSCWLEIMLIWIATPIAFLKFLSEGMPPESYLLLILGAVFGPIVIWLTSWPVYAFGELVHRACCIDMNTANGVKKSSVQVKQEDEKTAKLEYLRMKGLITEAEYAETLQQYAEEIRR